MNKILLSTAEKKKVTINFDMQCSELNLYKNEVILMKIKFLILKVLLLVLMDIDLRLVKQYQKLKIQN